MGVHVLCVCVCVCVCVPFSVRPLLRMYMCVRIYISLSLDAFSIRPLLTCFEHIHLANVYNPINRYLMHYYSNLVLFDRLLCNLVSCETAIRLTEV